jgi:Cu/Ag efflux protein CusF
MRVSYAAALATVALLLVPSPSPGQSLTEAAAKEKVRRKAAQKGKSFTDDDLRGGGGGSVSTGTDSGGGSTAKPAEAGKPGAKPKTEDEVKAEQSAAWRKKVDAANKKVTVLQETIDKIQLDLNDMSGGVYSSRRATLLSLLDDTKKQLAAAQQSVSDLEDEGRKNSYR